MVDLERLRPLLSEGFLLGAAAISRTLLLALLSTAVSSKLGLGTRFGFRRPLVEEAPSHLRYLNQNEPG